MSGLIKKTDTSVTRTGGGLVKTGTTAVSTGNATGTSMGKTIAKPDTTFVETKLAKTKAIGYVFDRTGSRSSSWAAAKVEQAKLLNKGTELKTRLVHFGGGNIGDTGWHMTPRPLVEEMERVYCEMGGTQILPSLERFTRPDEAPSLVMLVGDAYEENIEDIKDVARKFAINGTKIFAYQEGYDSTAEEAFKLMAEMTGGAYLKLGEDPSIDLGTATDAAIVWATQGDEGLKKLAAAGNKAALGVADSMKRLGM